MLQIALLALPETQGQSRFMKLSGPEAQGTRNPDGGFHLANQITLRMDTRESRTAWIIAGILFVLLLIVGYLWLTTPRDLETVLEDGYDNIVAQRMELERACRNNNPREEECQQEIRDLTQLLQEFTAEINAATSSAAASATTTVR